MIETKRADRRMEIEDAAYELLMEKGFSRISMLQIARRAKASNETLYRWYGDKQGLFGALVERNAQAGRQRLESVLAGAAPTPAMLEQFGAALLMGILSDKAVALNRVAAADMANELGAVLAQNGRETIVPLLTEVFDRGRVPEVFADAGEMTEVFLSLLISDLQAQRLLGRLAAPTPKWCAARAKRAVALFQRISHDMSG